MNRKFICAVCKQERISDWSEKEAREEYERLFKRIYKPDEVDVICDFCWNDAKSQGLIPQEINEKDKSN